MEAGNEGETQIYFANKWITIGGSVNLFSLPLVALL